MVGKDRWLRNISPTGGDAKKRKFIALAVIISVVFTGFVLPVVTVPPDSLAWTAQDYLLRLRYDVGGKPL